MITVPTANMPRKVSPLDSKYIASAKQSSCLLYCVLLDADVVVHINTERTIKIVVNVFILMILILNNILQSLRLLL